jgi:tetratricopeptide (TPR) repeat protein
MKTGDYDPLAAYSTPTMTERMRAFVANRDAMISLALALLLIAATALLYGRSLQNPLIFDDKPFFVETTLKQYGASIFQFNLRWFSSASFGWTYNLFGLNWFWFRLGNVGLHALTAILLFAFFYRLLVIVSQPQHSVPLADKNHLRWLAFFAALIFALHPIAVYGVAYLVERSIVMATLFSIAALLCYLEGLTKENQKWLLASTLFYFLAVFSKEHSVMLPGVAIALTLLLRKPSLSLMRQLWVPYLLFVVIGALIVLRSKGVLGSPYEPFAAEMMAGMSEQQNNISLEHAYPLSVITQAFLFFKYLVLWIVPYSGWISIDIRQPFATRVLSWPEFAGFVAFLAYPVLAARLLLKGGRKGLLGFGMLFPWVLYMTELSTVRIQEPFVLYRSYLWMSGLPVAILAIFGSLPKRTAIVVASVFCLLLAPLAWERLGTFSSNLKLWNDVVEKNRDEKLLGTERGYNNRGFAYLELDRYPEALSDFRKAIALNPNYSDAHFNIGIAYFKQNRIDEALQSYNQAIALKPDSGAAYLNRGVALLHSSRYAEALEDFNRALQINPWDAEALSNRGLTYPRLGNPQEGLADLDKAIELSPKLAQAHMNRGIINAMLGRASAALDDLNNAAKMNPNGAGIYYNRGNVYVAMKRYQDALQEYDKAIELDPNLADAYVNRGGLYMISSRLQDALAQFEKALSINPNHENAHLNRANIHAALSRYQDALNGYDRVLSFNPKNDQALLNRGLLLLAQHRQKEAVESLKKSCDAGNQTGCSKLKEAATR